MTSVWTNTGALGEVQGGQYAGYLFPMGPFFALGHALGLPDWLVQRLFVAALLFLAAWGTVRLLDASARAPPRAGRTWWPGLLMMFNPYTVIYLQTDLGHAAGPRRAAVADAGRAPRPARARGGGGGRRPWRC